MTTVYDGLSVKVSTSRPLGVRSRLPARATVPRARRLCQGAFLRDHRRATASLAAHVGAPCRWADDLDDKRRHRAVAPCVIRRAGTCPEAGNHKAVQAGMPILTARQGNDRTPLRNPLALVAHVVDQNVLAKVVGRGVERAAFVDAGHLIDKAGQPRRRLEHEGVDHDVLARGAAHLA